MEPGCRVPPLPALSMPKGLASETWDTQLKLAARQPALRLLKGAAKLGSALLFRLRRLRPGPFFPAQNNGRVHQG